MRRGQPLTRKMRRGQPLTRDNPPAIASTRQQYLIRHFLSHVKGRPLFFALFFACCINYFRRRRTSRSPSIFDETDKHSSTENASLPKLFEKTSESTWASSVGVSVFFIFDAIRVASSVNSFSGAPASISSYGSQSFNACMMICTIA